MTTSPTIMTGVNSRVAIRLKMNSSTFAIPGTSTLVAALVSHNHSRKLTEDIVVTDDPSGSDWDNSLVIVEIPGTLTEEIPIKDTKANLVLLIFDSDGFVDNPFILPVTLVKGHISEPEPEPEP